MARKKGNKEQQQGRFTEKRSKKKVETKEIRELDIFAIEVQDDSQEKINEIRQQSTKQESRMAEAVRNDVSTQREGGVGKFGGINGLWRNLNAEFPWIKIAVVIIVILAVFAGFKYHRMQKSTYITSDSTVYVGTRLKPPLKKARDLKGKKLVALTFDDGPSVVTPRLLDILAEKRVPVTFFVLGTMAQGRPEVVKREVKDGHEVASHTTWHQDLSKLNVEAIQSDMAESCRILTPILGKCSDLVRPPYGAINNNVKVGLGKPLIIWTVDTEDWRSKDARKVREEVKRTKFDGSIILMHDIYASTVDAVPGIIDDLRAEGYEFVTVSEMAEFRGEKLQNGVVYGAFGP